MDVFHLLIMQNDDNIMKQMPHKTCTKITLIKTINIILMVQTRIYIIIFIHYIFVLAIGEVLLYCYTVH